MPVQVAVLCALVLARVECGAAAAQGVGGILAEGSSGQGVGLPPNDLTITLVPGDRAVLLSEATPPGATPLLFTNSVMLANPLTGKNVHMFVSLSVGQTATEAAADTCARGAVLDELVSFVQSLGHASFLTGTFVGGAPGWRLAVERLSPRVVRLAQ